MPPEPRHSEGYVTLCTLLPFALLLALLAWIYPLTAHHHDEHPHPTTTPTTGP
ncbi:hypothetical protein ATKI12_7951 [Kitasatospora sp. Ki12]